MWARAEPFNFVPLPPCQTLTTSSSEVSTNDETLISRAAETQRKAHEYVLQDELVTDAMARRLAARTDGADIDITTSI